MIVISTHLDDAVWSCHGLLRAHPGALVVTVCAGIPPEDAGPTQFDTRAGFTSGAEAMRARREEDLAAAALVGFVPRHLDYMDSGYGSDRALVLGVEEALENVPDGEIVLGPLGLRHPDHERVSTTFQRIAADRDLNAWLYEDLPYAYAWPDDLAPALQRAGLPNSKPCALVTLPASAEKRAAVETYRSQIGPTTHMAEILSPERYHRL